MSVTAKLARVVVLSVMALVLLLFLSRPIVQAQPTASQPHLGEEKTIFHPDNHPSALADASQPTTGHLNVGPGGRRPQSGPERQIGPFCGALDVVFLLDTTSSMRGAITIVKNEVISLTTEIEATSQGDYQLGLVTFKDYVEVQEDLAAENAVTFTAAITALFASDGGNSPEASDEALNTVIHGLDEIDRSPGQQRGDFNGVFRPAAKKIAILITDAPPGGFDDTFWQPDRTNAHLRAVEAVAAGILISAVFVPTQGDHNDQSTIMKDYATTTGGLYIETDPDGHGISGGLIDIIQACGAAPAADLAITKLDTPDPVVAGQLLTYTIAITNRGPDEATGVIMTDTLPFNTLLNAVYSDRATCQALAGNLVCRLDDLAFGATALVTITVWVEREAVGIITNTVIVTATQPDPDLMNNTGVATTSIQPVIDLTVVKSDSPDPVRLDQYLTYLITVTNYGPALATGVILTDTLPPQVMFEAVNPFVDACEFSEGQIICKFDELASGANRVVTLIVRVGPPAPAILTNTVKVIAHEPDPFPANNTDTEPTVVVQDPTAIELLSFDAEVRAQTIVLTWQTASELNNYGFNLWRSQVEAGPYARLNGSLIPAQGNTTGASYTYLDPTVARGVTYYYKLEDVDHYSLSAFHGPVSARLSAFPQHYLPLVIH